MADAHRCTKVGSSSSPAETPYEQIRRFLRAFIDELDYEAMTDFFLTFRTYLSPVDLLDFLLTQYLQDTIKLEKLKVTKVRVFVALRHWLLNYYADDFHKNGSLKATMKAFLGRLGGIGADEITADAKIAKELRRVWDRESALYDCSAVNTARRSRSAKIIRESWLNRDCLAVTRRRRSCRIASRSSERRHSSVAALKILGSLKDSRTIYLDQSRQCDIENSPFDESLAHKSLPRERSAISPSLDALLDASEHNSSPVSDTLEAASRTPNQSRKLRRKPGGDLKQMQHEANLQPARALASEDHPDEFDETQFTDKDHFTDQDRNLQEKYSAWLLEVIHASEVDDEESEAVSSALASALDCLEGRHDPEHIAIAKQDVEVHDPIPHVLEKQEYTEQRKGSAKRKRRAGILQDLDTSPNKLARIASTPRKSKATEKSLDASPASQDMVSMVEALSIPVNRSPVSNTRSNQKEVIATLDTILTQNASQLAHSFGVVESAVFMELDWLELTSGLWIESSAALLESDEQQSLASDDITNRALGTAVMTARFQRVVSWIVHQIKFCKDEMERVSRVTKLIDIAVLCKNYNNFATLMQIMTGLRSPSIKRMRRTWNSLSRDTIRAWKALLSLCDDRNDWQTLQRFQEKALFDTQNSVVPFIGCYLSQLLQIERQMGNVDIVAKCRAIAKITKKLLVMHDRLRIETEYDETMVVCLSNIGL